MGVAGELSTPRADAEAKIRAAGGALSATIRAGLSQVVVSDTAADGRPVETTEAFKEAMRLSLRLVPEAAFFRGLELPGR